MLRSILLLSSLVIVTLFGTFSDTSAQSYSTYYGNQVMCPMDAYVCADGSTVGRTGPNCQFVCPVTQAPVAASYYYTSGCYTYYYNGYTRTTTITSYNCQNYTNYNTSYGYSPVTTTYSLPSYTTTYPSSQYQTYHYCNGSWTLSYSGTNGCNSILNYGNTNYNNYGYYNTQNYNQNYTYDPYNYHGYCYYINCARLCQ